jgi:hypothetical protein
MPIDPNIALSFRQPEIESPLNSYAKVMAIQHAQNQNALAQYQLSSAQRNDAQTNAMNEVYAQYPDLMTNPQSMKAASAALAARGAGGGIPVIAQKALDAQKAQAMIDQEKATALQRTAMGNKTNFDLSREKIDTAIKDISQYGSPDEVRAGVQKHLTAGDIDAQKAASILSTLPQDPAQFVQWKHGLLFNMLTAAQQLENQTHVVNQGNVESVVNTPKYGGAAPAVTATLPVGVSPNTAVTVAETARGHNMVDARARDRLAQETATGVLSPQTVDFVAQQVAQGNPMPALGMGKNAANMRAQILEKAATISTEGGTVSAADAAAGVIGKQQDVKTQQQTLNSFNKGPQAVRVTALNTAINHLETIDKLAADLNNTDTLVLNRAGNLFAKETGSAAPANFDAAKQIVAAEVIKAIVQNGGTGADRKEAGDAFNRANSPAQLRGVANTYRDLLAGQMQSLGQQYEQGTGRKDFEKRLAPNTQKVYKSATGAAVGGVDAKNPLLN